MFDVITIGGATRDVFLISDAFVALSTKRVKGGKAECVSLGSKIELNDLILTTGGGATNAAATFGSLGFQVGIMTKVGDDSPGKDVVEDLSRFGVSTKYVRMIPNGETGYSTLLTMPDGERTVLVYRGVSKTFTQKDIDWDGCKNTKWLYLTSLGGSFDLSKKIIEQAKKAGVRVMWNPGSGEIEAGLNAFLPLLPLIDILNMNKEEAIMLTKKRSIKEIAKSLNTPGMIRLITDGTQGVYAWQDDWAGHAHTTNVRAISRTGAGDAFGSGFLAGWIKKNHIRSALAIGMLNAQSVVQHYGAKKGIITSWPGWLKMNKINITTL